MLDIRKKFTELVKSSPYATQKYINHCIGVYNILKQKKVSDDVCNAGLYHSVYGTAYRNVHVVSDRNLVKQDIGEYAESLVHQFCSLSNRDDVLINNCIQFEYNFYYDLIQIAAANLTEENSNDPDVISKKYQLEIILKKMQSTGKNPFLEKNPVDKKIFVYDNLIDEDKLDHLIIFCSKSKYTCGQESGLNSFERDFHFSCQLSKDEFYATLIEDSLKKVIKKLKTELYLGKYYLNYYDLGTCHSRHTDSCSENMITIIVCCNKQWEENWGGELKFYNKDSKLNTVVDFVPGRIIVFDSRLEHKVLPVTPIAKKPRFSLAIKSSHHKGLKNLIATHGMERHLCIS